MCIYVREITNDEGNQLKRILRQSNDSFKVKRAQVILASAQRMRVPEISKVLDLVLIMQAMSYMDSMKEDLRSSNPNMRTAATIPNLAMSNGRP